MDSRHACARVIDHDFLPRHMHTRHGHEIMLKPFGNDDIVIT
jgi:hypothetical protein